MDPFSLLRPQPCPHRLIRIGGDGDGAYLIPDDLEGIDACFSPGVYNRKDFEDELAHRFGIRSHLCDFSSSPERLQTPLLAGLQTFEAVWLDTKGTPDSVCLDDWIRRHEPAPPSGDLILQMDIEGGEARNLLSTSESCLQRFRIIAIELHNLDALRHYGSWKWTIKVVAAQLWRLGIRPILKHLQEHRLVRRALLKAERNLEPYLLGRLLLKLNRTHQCVHAHANNNCHYRFTDRPSGMNIPSLLELTYLRKDRCIGDANSLRQPCIPHPLDIVNNSDRPAELLNAHWLPSPTRTLS